MAFVYRTQQKQNQSNLQTPGPGSYLQKNKNRSQQLINSSAPFNNSSNRELWKKDYIPGPGSYLIENSIKKQKKLLFQPTGQISIYEAPKQSVAFKSKTMRFAQMQNKNIPGPGEYQVQVSNNNKFVNSTKKSRHSSSQLKTFLKQKNQIFRNTIKQEHFQKEMIISASQNINLISQYEENYQNINKKSKNSIFFSSKVQREFIKVRPQTSAGPGSYNITKSSFQIGKKQQKRKPTKSICIERKKQKQHQEVGPGYYNVQVAYKNLNRTNSSKKKKFECFGSTADRFNFFLKMSTGTSSHETFLKSKNDDKMKSTGCVFGKQERKVFQSHQNHIGPGYYQTSDNLLIERNHKQKGKSINKYYFGSSKQRFSNPKCNSTDRKKQQITKNIIVQNNYNFDQQLRQQNKFKHTKTFKTLLKSRKRDYRSLLPNNSSQINTNIKQIIDSDKPLCYDNLSHTLGFKYGKKRQLDAPFLSGAQRFKQQTKNNNILFTNQNKVENNKPQYNKKQNSNSRKFLSKNKQKKGQDGFGMKDTRFKYKQQKQNKDLGPQSYDVQIFKKKSYNTLFNS